MPVLRRVAGPARSLLYLVLGGALVVPVIAGIAVILPTDRVTTVAILAACTLPAAVAIASLPFVRRIEVLAARELLAAELPPHPQQGAVFGLTVAHLSFGAVYSALVLAFVVPVLTAALGSPADIGSSTLVGALIAVAGLVVTVPLIGGAFRSAVRRLVTSDPRRMAQDRERRDTMARELHDSIGHALSVITVQTEAARVSRSDPALDHIARAAGDAQQELDLMLAMLREHETPHGPDLSAVPRILEGLPVAAELDRVDRVPDPISRTAYRIVQEGLANAMRHGDGEVRLRLTVRDELRIEIRNRLGDTGSRVGGWGLAGMRRRARLVGGDCLAERNGDHWVLDARIPL